MYIYSNRKKLIKVKNKAPKRQYIKSMEEITVSPFVTPEYCFDLIADSINNHMDRITSTDDYKFINGGADYDAYYIESVEENGFIVGYEANFYASAELDTNIQKQTYGDYQYFDEWDVAQNIIIPEIQEGVGMNEMTTVDTDVTDDNRYYPTYQLTFYFAVYIPLDKPTPAANALAASRKVGKNRKRTYRR